MICQHPVSRAALAPLTQVMQFQLIGFTPFIHGFIPNQGLLALHVDYVKHRSLIDYRINDLPI